MKIHPELIDIDYCSTPIDGQINTYQVGLSDTIYEVGLVKYFVCCEGENLQIHDGTTRVLTESKTLKITLDPKLLWIVPRTSLAAGENQP